MHNTENKLNYQ